MNCTAVRDRLPERALGALEARESVAFDRHLQWCAACRKEAGELDAAAGTLAFALAPAEPDPALEDRVVEAVRRAAGRRQGRPAGRRGRLAVAAMTAAMIAVAGLGWGAVMAGKAARSEEQAKAATARQQTAADRFEWLVNNLEFSSPQNQVLIGQLAPTRGTGGGSAFTLVSPTMIDMAVVMVTQLPQAPARDLPYVAQLDGPRRPRLVVGHLKLDAGGSAMISRNFNRNLAGYRRVVVRDAAGRIVMSGALATRASLASPAP